jgi:selenocysteine-specific elongation factor
MAGEAARALLAELARRGAIRVDRDTAALPGHRPSLSGEEERLAEALSALFLEAGLEPPEPAEALARVGAPGPRGEALLAHQVRAGTLKRLRDGRLFHAAALADLVTRLREYRTRSETIDIAAFKDLAGVSRKNAIPLLEHLDEERVTLRKGSDRVILG